MGSALGNECQAENVAFILGPAVNIKRSPLCGRNFEYYSEDPFLASGMAAAHVDGVQSQGVGTSLKHFLANNQEHRRLSSNSVIDERTLREIYLAAFEGVVKEAKPWTVMCSYNRVNGEYTGESKRFLSDILRDEWNFDGIVVSDWGAVNDRLEGVKAGLDLEMPSSCGLNDARIVKAVQDGNLNEKVLDRAVERILDLIDKHLEKQNEDAVWDKEADHQLARKISGESMVLLKNEDSILPLDRLHEIAFIGEFASKPRYQGGGSSHINSYKTTSAWECVMGHGNIKYSKGYSTEEDVVDEACIVDAVEVAKNAECAVIFAGLPDSFESEGYDRKHMRMPECQNRLIEEVAKVQPNTVVVLHNGSPVEMPWASQVKGILEVYLGGQAVGEATVDVLFGDVNPSGRLPETFPRQLEDNPSFLYYRGEEDTVEYREGVFVGYRYYDKKKMDVLFPFGYGLSYTNFTYSNLAMDKNKMMDSDVVSVCVDVTNTGNVAGKEVVQLYVAPEGGEIIRPVRELKGFQKIFLEPGETKTVKFLIEKRAFAYFDTSMDDWNVESGNYQIQIGKSSRDIVLSVSIFVESSRKDKKIFTVNSTFGDAMKIPGGRETIAPLLAASTTGVAASDSEEEGLNAVSKDMEEAMLQYMPLRGPISFGEGAITHEKLKEIVDKLNSL